MKGQRNNVLEEKKPYTQTTIFKVDSEHQNKKKKKNPLKSHRPSLPPKLKPLTSGAIYF